MDKHIAELEKAVGALRESEEILRYIVRHDPNAIAVYDCNLNYIAVSERYLSDYNVKEDDIIGKHHYEVFPEMPQRWKDIHQRCLSGEILHNDDDFFERPDGTITYNRWECRPWHRINGEIGGMITYTEVTTERKKAEIALRESEEMMRYIVKHDPNAIAVYDCNLHYIAVSERFLLDYGVKEDDIIGKHHYEVFPEMPEKWMEIHQRCLAGEVLREEDDSFVNLDGSITYFRWECRPWQRINGEVGGMISYTEVTTENKIAQNILKENEEKYRYIFANNPQPMWIFDLETLAFLEVNDAAVAHYGYSREEFMQMTILDIRPPDEIPMLYKIISSNDSSKNPPQGWRHRKKNGEIIYVEIASHSILFEGREAYHILINDITKRKAAEDKLVHMTRLYAMLSQISQAIVHTKNRDTLFAEICQTAIHHGQFKLAWIGWIDQTGNELIPVAKAGFDDGYVNHANYIIDKYSIGKDPIGMAVQEEKIITSFDIGGDPRMYPWRDQALKRGYRSLAAVPFKCKEKTVGALILYASDPGFFTVQEQQLLKELSGEIAFALTAMAIEQENKLAKEELSNSELRYQRLFESSKDGILLIDAESGIITDANASLSEISGYPHQEYFKKHIWENEFLKQLIPNHAYFESFKKSIDQQIREISLQPKEGENIYIEVVYNTYKANNRKVIQCNLRNITQRKVAELKLKDALTEAQRFRKTLDHVSSYIYMKDLQSRYIYANKHTLELFNCSDDQLIGSDDLQFFPRETAAKLKETDLRVFRGEETKEEILVNNPETGLRVYLEVKVPIYMGQEDKTICGLLGISTDITDRKLIENRLIESEERFRTVAQSITDVIYEYDMNNDIDWYGDIDQLMGYLPGEFPRNFEGIKKITHPDDKELLTNSLKQILTTGIANTVEYRVQKKSGEWCWWIARRSLTKDKNGSALKLIGSITDITEQKKIKDEVKFQTDLLNQVGQAVIATDNDGQVTYWNKAAEKIYGWTAEEAHGENIIDLTPTDMSKEDALMITSEIQKGKIWSGEFMVKRKDGSSFPSYVTDAPIFDASGNLIGVIGISTDITDRKQTEEKLLLLSRAFGQTVDSIVITDKNGIIKFVNKAFETTTGYKEEEALGNTPRILKSGHHDNSFYENMWAIILSGKIFRQEIINMKKNGELYWVEKTISPIFDQHKNITHFVGTGVDISERKRAENELIKAKEKAEEGDRLKSAFLANMSHEVRTPLNSILGFSSLLSDPDFDQDQKDEFISHIIKNGNALLNVISDIVDISKIEAGEITIHKSQFNLRKFINGVYQQFSFQASERQLELILKLPAQEIDPLIDTDPDRLNQIFCNLVSNALKFTHQGHIEIGYQLMDQEVVCYVSDTGIGIPKEYHEKIFDRFRQVEEEKTRKYGGNGLGLAITKNLVGLMDGRIWLESEPGKGSAFYFTLPWQEL